MDNILYGNWMQIGNSDISEILDNIGYDFIVIDMEHTNINLLELTNIFKTIKNSDKYVRISENNNIIIRQVLDLGADGIIVPLINNRIEAEKVIKSALYPPDGNRGFAYCRANNYGENFTNYVKNANNNIKIIIMIESKEAINNLEDILKLDKIYGILIGLYDLSGSYNIPGDINNIIIKNACIKISKICKKYNKKLGIHIVNPTKENVNESINNGYNMIVLGMDNVYLRESCKNKLLEIKNIKNIKLNL